MTTNETRRDVEALADEIAHDLVSPPDDDAPEVVVADVLRYVRIARCAALAALRAGCDVDSACEAAEEKMDAYARRLS